MCSWEPMITRTFVNGQSIHAGVIGIRLADGTSWHKFEAELLQSALMLDASAGSEVVAECAIVFDKAVWRRPFWARFFCALVGVAGAASFPAASS